MVVSTAGNEAGASASEKSPSFAVSIEVTLK
jgi:hypothetical protein